MCMSRRPIHILPSNIPRLLITKAFKYGNHNYYCEFFFPLGWGMRHHEVLSCLHIKFNSLLSSAGRNTRDKKAQKSCKPKPLAVFLVFEREPRQNRNLGLVLLVFDFPPIFKNTQNIVFCVPVCLPSVCDLTIMLGQQV